MLELALVVYAALAMFFLLMARSEKRRKGEPNTISSVALSVAWPVLLLMVVVHVIGAKLRKPTGRRGVQRPVHLSTQKQL